MNNSINILQIIPKMPGQHEGVGHYALIVARGLRETHGIQTVFAAADLSAPASVEGFDVLPLASLLRHPLPAERYHRLLLHYVGYGYQARGVPFSLVGALRDLRHHCQDHLLTIFHETAASGPPWRSAFWLRPFQIRIVRSIVQLSDRCVVSSETSLTQLRRLVPAAGVSVQPVPSGFGEPDLSQARLAEKDPRQWVICGGTALLERSVRSFRRILRRLPAAFSPRELFVLGGNDNLEVRAMLSDLPEVKTLYHPRIERAAASEILSRCSFGWIDYFHQAAAPVDALFKSSVFAAFCAHGVIPVLPHPTAPLVLEETRLPGLFWVNQTTAQLPPPDERAGISGEIYHWYHGRASSKHLTRLMSAALGLAAGRALTS